MNYVYMGALVMRLGRGTESHRESARKEVEEELGEYIQKH